MTIIGDTTPSEPRADAQDLRGNSYARTDWASPSAVPAFTNGEAKILRALAEAFSAFGNDAIGAMHRGTADVACIASGMQAVAWRLEEIAKVSAVDLFPRPPRRAASIDCSEGIVSVHFDSDEEARAFFEGLQEEGELERLTHAVVDATRRAEEAERDLRTAGAGHAADAEWLSGWNVGYRAACRDHSEEGSLRQIADQLATSLEDLVQYAEHGEDPEVFPEEAARLDAARAAIARHSKAGSFASGPASLVQLQADNERLAQERNAMGDKANRRVNAAYASMRADNDARRDAEARATALQERLEKREAALTAADQMASSCINFLERLNPFEMAADNEQQYHAALDGCRVHYPAARRAALTGDAQEGGR